MSTWIIPAIQIGTQVVQGVIKGNNARKDAERHNETIRAKQAWLEQEKVHSRKVYELATLSRYFDNFSAGTRRIAQTGFSGASKSASAKALGQFDDMLLRRDLSVSDLRIRHDFRNIENEIETLKGQIKDPSDERKRHLTSAFTKSAQVGAKAGAKYAKEEFDFDYGEWI